MCFSIIDFRDKAFEETLQEASFSPLKKQRTKSPELKKSLSSKLSKLKDEKSEKESASGSKKKSPEKCEEQVIKSPDSKSNESLNDSSIIPGTPGAEKEARKAAYMKYVSRGGAKNPGSKEVPQGSPGCFDGLVFVLTGVYDSLEREEMAEIVKNLGGKVTTSISKNTKFLVVGQEAGESKLSKAKTLGTPTLTEDQFLDLIREKSVKEKENKTPKTSPEKDEKKKLSSKKEVKEEKKPTPTKESHKKETPKKTVKEEKVSPKKEPKSKDVIAPKLTIKESPKKEPKAPSLKKIEPEERKPLVGASVGSGSGETELFVDKYKPSNCKGIIGQQGDKSNMNKLKNWLNDWNRNHLHNTGKKGASKPAPWVRV